MHETPDDKLRDRSLSHVLTRTSLVAFGASVFGSCLRTALAGRAGDVLLVLDGSTMALTVASVVAHGTKAHDCRMCMRKLLKDMARMAPALDGYAAELHDDEAAELRPAADVPARPELGRAA